MAPGGGLGDKDLDLLASVRKSGGMSVYKDSASDLVVKAEAAGPYNGSLDSDRSQPVRNFLR
jgi:hypothetical protein